MFTGQDGGHWGDWSTWLPSKYPSLLLPFITSLRFESWSRRKNLDPVSHLQGHLSPPVTGAFLRCTFLPRDVQDCSWVGADPGVFYFSRVSKDLLDLQEQKGLQATRQVSCHSVSICLSLHTDTSFLSLSVSSPPLIPSPASLSLPTPAWSEM